MAKRKQSKKKKNVWFIEVRGSYLPASPEGWLIYIPLLGAGLLILTAVFFGLRDGMHVGNALLELAFGLAFLWAVFTWLAKLKA